MSLDHWVEKNSKELNKELAELEHRLGKETKLLEELNSILELLTYIAEKEREIKKSMRDIEIIKVDFANTKNNVREIKNNIIHTREKLKKAEDSNFFGRLLAGLNPKKLEKLLDQLSSSLAEENSKLARLNRQLKTQEDALRTTKKSYAERKDRLVSLASEKEIVLEEKKVSGEVSQQKEIIKGISQRIDAVKNTIQELAHNIIKNAKLVGTTITKGYLNRDIYERSFDVVIVDEASMAPLPALFFDSGLATSKVVITGDFRQLAPIAIADDELVEKWLRRDIFEVSGITKKVNRGKKEERLAILKEQRRMPREIAELVNETVYPDNPLDTEKKPPEEEKKEKVVFNSEPFRGKNIILCDTSEFNPWCTKSPIRHSPFNVYNALLSVYLAEQALLDGVSDIAIFDTLSSPKQSNSQTDS